MSGSAEASASGLVIGGAIGAIAVVAGALINGAFGYFGHQGDIDAKMIELSVGILRAAPTDETRPLREWAIDEMEKRGAGFTPEQRAALLNKELPFKPGAFSSVPTSQSVTMPALGQ